MMSKKGSFIVWALVALGIFGPPPALWAGRGNPGEKKTNLGEQVLDKAAAYLHSKQSADGAWRSETYGLLKSGQSLTPFVLFALTDSTTGKGRLNEGSIGNALGFLRTGIDSNGVLGRADPDFLDYPNYSTAYALRSFLRFGKERDQERILKMRSYLEARQFSEEDGFEPSSPAYGGWGFGIEGRPHPFEFRRSFAHPTRPRLLAQVKPVDPSSMAGRTLSRPFAKKPAGKKIPPYPWLHQGKPCDRPMTAVLLLPTVAYANKGRTGVDPKTGHAFYRSYATATCDGILLCSPSGSTRPTPHHFRRPMAEGS